MDIYSKNILFENVEIPFAAYQKKKEYGYGLLDVKNFKLDNYLVKFTKDKKSKIILDDLMQMNNQKSKKMLSMVNQ